MQLPDFIKRALAFFDKAEEQLKAGADAAAKISSLEKDKTDAAATIKDLRAELQKAKDDLKAATDKIGELEGKVAKEKTKAETVIAGQGLPAGQVPAAETAKGGAGAGTDGETAWTKYQNLLATNPRAAGAFWAKSADEIIASSN